MTDHSCHLLFGLVGYLWGTSLEFSQFLFVLVYGLGNGSKFVNIADPVYGVIFVYVVKWDRQVGKAFLMKIKDTVCAEVYFVDFIFSYPDSLNNAPVRFHIGFALAC